MKTNLLVLLTLLCFTCQSQNLIFVGNKSYQATQKWFMDGNGDQFEYYANSATIQVGKNGNFGVFSISTNVYNRANGIKGSSRIYLNDGSTILLSKILATDFADSYYTILYEISTINLTKLKNSNINSIRFNSGYTNDLKGTTVSNRHSQPIDSYRFEEINWKTADDVRSLFY